jgi:hypothetical protein
MTEETEEDEALAKLEATFNRVSRKQRTLIVVQVSAVCCLMLCDLALIWLGGGHQAWRDAWMVLGLSLVGLGVCATRVTDWQFSRMRDAREIALLRSLDVVIAVGVSRPAPPQEPTVH